MECLWYLAGVLTGSFIAAICLAFRTKLGTLKIDHSNPEKDIYRLDLGDLDGLSKAKTVILKVDHKADLSQK